jgi:hypothetical protein
MEELSKRNEVAGQALAALIFFASIQYTQSLGIFAPPLAARASSRPAPLLEQLWRTVIGSFQAMPVLNHNATQPPRLLAFSLTFLSLLSQLPRPCALLRTQAFPRGQVLDAVNDYGLHQLCVSLFDLGHEGDQHPALAAARAGLLAEGDLGVWNIDSVNRALLD